VTARPSSEESSSLRVAWLAVELIRGGDRAVEGRILENLAALMRSHGGDQSGADPGGALPNLIVIGAMKCGTTALHHHLDCHPDIAMSKPKELNFFFGPDRTDGWAWAAGNWSRGVAWYARHFDAQAAVRGESSPGYTSPSHPEAAQRMSTLVPAARLVYLVRDPVQRAISQYRHHQAEGTETRPMEKALLDPDSQYIARSRYHDRLVPFLAHFHQRAIAIVCQEELAAQPQRTLQGLYGFVGVDPGHRPGTLKRQPDSSDEAAARPGGQLHHRLVDALRDDADRLRDLAGRDFPGWSL
jgi:Sulfotransferase family